MRKMDRKGEEGDILKSNVIYLILLVLFTIGMGVYVYAQMQGTAIWEEFYIKEIVKIINFGERNDSVCLNIHKLTALAKDNDVSLNDIINIDNVKKRICIKTTPSHTTCLRFFNEVNIINYDIKLFGGKDENDKDVNLFCFDIVRRRMLKDEKG